MEQHGKLLKNLGSVPDESLPVFNFSTQKMNLVLALIALIAIVQGYFFSAVVHDTSLLQVKLVNGYDQSNGVAWASFQQTMNQTGWDVLQISTNASASDDLQAFSAGYIEVFLIFS